MEGPAIAKLLFIYIYLFCLSFYQTILTASMILVVKGFSMMMVRKKILKIAVLIDPKFTAGD